MKVCRSILTIGASLLMGPTAQAGALSGPVLDVGTTAVLEDFVALPPSAPSRPLARVNVTREVTDGSGRLFSNDLNGAFYVIDSGVATTYFDLSLLRPQFRTSPGIGAGFVSFAFHPDFATNGLFYTVHTENVAGGTPNLGPAIATTIVQHDVLSEWHATDPGANVFSGTSRELMRIAAGHSDHNVGEIAFNPNAQPLDEDYGLLYICAGEFGSVYNGQPDQLQRLDSPYGALMRIDPLGGPFTRNSVTYDYGIPGSNPFANHPDPNVLGEIYAYGFRNGHRIEWDRGGGDEGPFVSDIGQGNLEEINRLIPGANYGWPEREGSYALDVDVNPETVFALPPDDASFGFRYPVAQYDHAEGVAIAGGIVYRGSATPSFAGQMVFGDIRSGRLFYTSAADLLAADDGDPATTAQVYEFGVTYQGQPTTLSSVVASALGLSSINRVDLRFAADESGQIYVSTKQDGRIRTLTPVPEPSVALSVLAGGTLVQVLAKRRGLRTVSTA